MLMRAWIIGVLPLICAACANEPPAKVVGFQTSATAGYVARGDGASMTGSLSGEKAATPPRKTLGDKVLTAIALERVTGRKPDPARLVE